MSTNPLPRYLLDDPVAPPFATTPEDRRAHVLAVLYRNTSIGAKYITALLNASPAGKARHYPQAEVQRHLAELDDSGQALYTAGKGWKRR